MPERVTQDWYTYNARVMIGTPLDSPKNDPKSELDALRTIQRYTEAVRHPQELSASHQRQATYDTFDLARVRRMLGASEQL